MPKISSKNQVTLPSSALDQVGLRAGEQVVVEPIASGELRIRRNALGIDDALGALTGVYPPDYLEQLDAEDAKR